MLRNALETNPNLFTKFIATCSSIALLAPLYDPLVGIVHARRMFDHRPHRDDAFLCNSMIKAYVGMRQYSESFALYRDLRRNTSFTPDSFTFSVLAKSCALNMAIWEGQEIHSHVVAVGFGLDLYAATALVDMYAKFGKMDCARKLFDEMIDRSQVSWTALIGGYVRSGDMDNAGKLFDQMIEKDSAAFNTMIDAYVKLGDMCSARKLFDEMPERSSLLDDYDLWVLFVRRKKLDRATNVGTALIDMYAKCGEIVKARGVFDNMPEKETASWNALINGFAINGRAKEALGLFMEMNHKGFKPNEITMIGVLSACNHSGLVEEGKRWFKAMEEFGLTPKLNTMVACSFLFACGYSKDVARSERVLKEAIKMEAWNDGNYIMLRNLYANEKRWKEADEVKGLMRRNGVKKEAGCSAIEVDSRVWEFVAGDRVHPKWEAIHSVLGQLWAHMKGTRLHTKTRKRGRDMLNC
ncbi:hypothetical protein AAG906_024618 [Vitis piasezkii]